MPLVSVFDITGKDGYHQHLEIFRMPLTKRSKNLSTDAYGEYDADRFYATMNDYRDTVIVQSYNFKKLWRKAYEFYQPDEK
jgi:ATP adenylyltransferase/5',5'''-P-1,P-4-tetraphosphate phosphorylase II